MSGAKSAATFKVMPGSAKEAALLRPTTAVISDAPTAATGAPGMASAVSVNNLNAMNNRAISMSRFSKFEEQEKSTKSHPFKVFYTSNEQTAFHKENRFEGKSNYQAYYPTGEMHEQELEQIWFDDQNKRLADKRRDEEAKQTMKDWGIARGRMEAEIARKKEHLNSATNFEKARGWTRSSWKTKFHEPRAELNHENHAEFMNASSSEDDSPGQPDEEASAVNTGRTGRNKTGMTTAPPVYDLSKDEKAYKYRPSTAVMAK
jgi:hypothetical protein